MIPMLFRKFIAASLFMVMLFPVVAFSKGEDTGAPVFSSSDCDCVDLTDMGMNTTGGPAETNPSTLNCQYVGKGTEVFLDKTTIPPNIRFSIMYYATHEEALSTFQQMTNTYRGEEESKHYRVIQTQDTSSRYSYLACWQLKPNASYYFGTRAILYKEKYYIEIGGEGNYTSDERLQSAFDKVEACAEAAIDRNSGEQTFSGTITGFGVPMKHILVSVSDGTLTYQTTTDENGHYELFGAIAKGTSCTLTITYSYVLNQTTYFSLHFREHNTSVVSYKQQFTFNSAGDLTRNIAMEQEMPRYYSGDWAKTFASMYVHFTEALEFYKDGLHVNVTFQLPLDIYTFVPMNTGTRYWYTIPGKSFITIDEEKSTHESVYRPMHLEYHEFSHYIMHTLYQKWPAPSTNPDNIEERNHDGYLNPSTSDSYVEGFAEFMSAVMLETYEQSGLTIPMVPPSDHDKNEIASLDYHYNTQWDGMELNAVAFGSNGRAEERAIAGTLWDLYDDPTDYTNNMSAEQAYQLYQQDLPNIRQDYAQAKENHESAVEFWNITGPEAVFPPLKILTLDDIREFMRTHRFDDDNVTTIQMQGVWNIIKNFHNDFTSVYNDFIAKYPAQKKAIDDVFISHGLYVDTNPGNGVYDSNDMYRDENHNGRHDTGEYYVDCPIDGFTYKPGETVGQATNYNRLWRQSVQEVPGYFIKVNNTVPFYLVKISFPNAFYLDSVVREWNEHGLVYVPVPPQGYYALVTVIPEGVQSSVPLSFASDVFQHDYNLSLTQGYYVEHDFQVTGPIPPLPSMPGETTINGNSNQKQTPGFEAILFLGGCLFVCMLLKKQRRYKTK